MYASNPLEASCVLHAQTLRNRRGAILSDPQKVSRFTVTVGTDEMPVLIAELFTSYRECTDRKAAAALLANVAKDLCLPSPRTRVRRTDNPALAGMFAQERE